MGKKQQRKKRFRREEIRKLKSAQEAAVQPVPDIKEPKALPPLSKDGLKIALGVASLERIEAIRMA